MKRFKVAVVGLRFGQFLVRALAHLEGAQLVALADRSPKIVEGLDTYAARYGAKAYRSSDDMFANEALDAVAIATAPRARAAIIEQAAARGIAMFVEKPWATNPSHAAQLAAICQRHDATVMLGFSFRFHPVIARLRKLLDGELGEGWMLNGEYVFDYLPPEDGWFWDPANGNGMFNENSCHLFDAVCYLMGKPVSVTAEAARFVGRPSEEAAAISLKFESGGIAALTVGGYGANAHWDYPRIDITTRHGQARLRGRHHMWDSLAWAKRSEDTVSAYTQPAEILGTTRYTHAFTHFFERLRTGEQPSATIEDGMLSVAIADAVAKSARSGVKVSLDLD
ncbi:MAG: Gfo/Idh/MocA family oxidoreductase [Chloroflexi bacterium]|nr:Gfo/Idh/MocA family oxidoreductase [Chloroflexota bacterium]